MIDFVQSLFCFHNILQIAMSYINKILEDNLVSNIPLNDYCMMYFIEKASSIQTMILKLFSF